MHKSPDRSGHDRSHDTRDLGADAGEDRLFKADLADAEALEAADAAPRDPKLAADWALRRQLAGLGAADLPAGVAARARFKAAARPHAPWYVAVAATLFAAVVVTLVLRAPEPPPEVAAPTAREMAELELALETLDATGRRAVAIAGREVSGSLKVPDLGLDELPYAEYVRPYLSRGDLSRPDS